MRALFLLLVFPSLVWADEPVSVRVGVFDLDASPPVGTPLAYDPTKAVEMSLRCRGVVILGSGKPIVLCAIDWIGVGNDSLTEFKEWLAKGAGTTADRVAVHALHQHDAPRCDFTAQAILEKHKIKARAYDVIFARTVIRKTSAAVGKAVKNAKRVTHLGIGEGIVDKVASNRRILGENGKVIHVRWTATRDPKVRAFPAGLIDPKLKLISFWNEDKAVAALTYYATHPQSYYRTGKANPDFPGIARLARDKKTGVMHVHFNGAGGNIGAGKWNDGSPKNRQVLADRVAQGMRKAWENTKKTPVAASDIGWETADVLLPLGKHLKRDALLKIVEDESQKTSARFAAARNLAWVRRCEAKDPISLSCLRLGNARVLHMPGELFVEYQLAAQKMAPRQFVAMAAYGDYAPGYIGTKIAYSQGGYETSARASRVAPGVEAVLMKAIRRLLSKK